MKQLAYWQTLKSDEGARFDRVVQIDAASLEPHVTWGTSPGMVVPVNEPRAGPAEATSAAEA